MNATPEPTTDLIDRALQMLGIRRLAISIHDHSFPSTAEDDIGRGSPYSQGGRAFLGFARRLGFNTVQLGPQGKTPPDDPSPYNSAIFSKNILSLSPPTLAANPRLAGLVAPHDVEQWRSLAAMALGDGGDLEPPHRRARRAAETLLDTLYHRYRQSQGASPALAAAFQEYVATQRAARVDWLTRDGLFEALSLAAGTDDWRLWGTRSDGLAPLDQRLYLPHAGEEEACRRRIDDLTRAQAAGMERAAFGQFLIQIQHDRLRDDARQFGLALFGDMHIGFSHQDCWAWRSLFLPDYFLGAPPSRTTPAGQPWAYPVLHPRLLRTPSAAGGAAAGPALRFVQARAEKLLSEFDGLRIDHPQGLVCPWVYRSDEADPFAAVRGGARLYSSPALADHPALAEFSIVAAEQLNDEATTPRYADDHVRELRPDQIDRYALALDAILDSARRCGRATDDVLCEVLSTWPAPLRAVMTSRGIGRFCITQKVDPCNPHDIYRPEGTAPRDWIMVGNHDTRPFWRVMDEPKFADKLSDHCRRLAERLEPKAERRAALAAALAADRGRLASAMFADLFLGPAQHVLVFFADLLGETRSYNEPGTIGAHNWTLRVPNDFEQVYAERVARRAALDMPAVLAMALRAKAERLGGDALDLAARLEAAAGQGGG